MLAAWGFWAEMISGTGERVGAGTCISTLISIDARAVPSQGACCTTTMTPGDADILVESQLSSPALLAATGRDALVAHDELEMESTHLATNVYFLLYACHFQAGYSIMHT